MLSLDEGETLRVPPIAGVYGHDVPRRLVPEIVSARVHALFDRVAAELREAAVPLAAGVVLTGGAAALGGLADTAEAILHHHARRAAPCADGPVADVVNTAAFATAVGLVLRAGAAAAPAASPFGAVASWLARA
jgi:cell division protein FtsA